MDFKPTVLSLVDVRFLTHPLMLRLFNNHAETETVQQPSYDRLWYHVKKRTL